MKYAINKAFHCSVERTPRVLEVAEAFGLGLSDREFVIFKDLELEIGSGQVVYITGQSGSGKSLLLRDLKSQMSKALQVADLADIVLPEKPVIEILGKSTQD